MAATMVWKVDELGNRVHALWMIPKDEAEECCVLVDVGDHLADTALEGEGVSVSPSHVYVTDGHWQEHFASR